MSDKPKFTLHSVQHRVAKKDILLDVVIGDEVVENYPVAWVKLRGSEDPLYLKNITPILVEKKDLVDVAQEKLKKTEDSVEIQKITDEITKLLTELMNASVVEALCDWDAEFFGEEFSKEAAHKIFTDAANNQIYNQIAEYMKERESFLPIASK